MSGEQTPGMTRRRVLRLGAVALAGLGGGGYGLWSNTLRIEHTVWRGFGLRAPLRVVVLSDLHAPHTWVDPEALNAAVRDADPDIIVFLGDIIDEAGQEDAVQAWFTDLPARSARLAILGNWEHWSRVDLPAVQRGWAAAGFELLINGATTLQAEGGEVVFVGLDDLIGGSPRPDEVEVARRDRPVVVLSHCPASADPIAAAARGPTLVLSGHTHGGQLAPLGLSVWTPPGSGGYVGGWYTPAPGCGLYVSTGLGNSRINMRLGARPTLTVLELS